MDVNLGPDAQRPRATRVFQREGEASRIVYPFSQSVNVGRLAWRPDGRQIFCVYDAEDKKRYTLLLNANGQGVVEQGIENSYQFVPRLLAPMEWKIAGALSSRVTAHPCEGSVACPATYGSSTTCTFAVCPDTPGRLNN